MCVKPMQRLRRVIDNLKGILRFSLHHHDNILGRFPAWRN